MMLEIKGLRKTFGGLVAVDKFDLSIGEGELVGLIGPNGAGKTCTFNLLSGFLRPTSGQILFDGQDITGRQPHYIAKKGLVRIFQATSVFPDFTVLENVIAGAHLNSGINVVEGMLRLPSSRRKEKELVLQAREILDFVGLGDVSGGAAKNLSHGYKRTLSIAIALAAKPKLLLLDEPTSGMNAGEVTDATELIIRIQRTGTTILLIEHNMRMAMSICERIAVLSFGKKIAEGLPEEIRTNKDVIEAYLGVDADATA